MRRRKLICGKVGKFGVFIFPLRKCNAVKVEEGKRPDGCKNIILMFFEGWSTVELYLWWWIIQEATKHLLICNNG